MLFLVLVTELKKKYESCTVKIAGSDTRVEDAMQNFAIRFLLLQI